MKNQEFVVDQQEQEQRFQKITLKKQQKIEEKEVQKLNLQIKEQQQQKNQRLQNHELLNDSVNTITDFCERALEAENLSQFLEKHQSEYQNLIKAADDFTNSFNNIYTNLNQIKVTFLNKILFEEKLQQHTTQMLQQSQTQQIKKQ